MEISQTALAFMLLCSLISGAGLGLFYDALRIVRAVFGVSCKRTSAIGDGVVKASFIERVLLPCLPLFAVRWCRTQNNDVNISKKGLRHKRNILPTVIIFVGDVIFGTVVGLTAVILTYYTNNGQTRGFVFLGMAIGFAVYRLTLAKLVRGVSDIILFAVKVGISYSLYFLSFPVIKVFALLRYLARKATEAFRSIYRSRRISVYCKNEKLRLEKLADTAFMNK